MPKQAFYWQLYIASYTALLPVSLPERTRTAARGRRPSAEGR